MLQHTQLAPSPSVTVPTLQRNSSRGKLGSSPASPPLDSRILTTLEKFQKILAEPVVDLGASTLVFG